MNFFSSIASFFKNLFGSKKKNNDEPPVVSSPPPVVVVSSPATPAPTTTAPQPSTGSSNPMLDAYLKSNPPVSGGADSGDSSAAPAVVPTTTTVVGDQVVFVEGGVGQNIVMSGPCSRTLQVPAGWKGFTIIQVGVNPRTKFPYSVYVNGDFVATAVTDGTVQRQVNNPVGAVVVRVDQTPDSSVTVEFRNYKAQ